LLTGERFAAKALVANAFMVHLREPFLKPFPNSRPMKGKKKNLCNSIACVAREPL
jgi:hypothetical protein